MAPSSHAYRAFTSIFEAFEAPYYCREMVLQFPGCRCTVNEPNLVPEEFVAEENDNYRKDMSASEGVSADDETVRMPNLQSPPQDEEPSEVIQQGPLTFDPLPLTEEGEDIQLAAKYRVKVKHYHCNNGQFHNNFFRQACHDTCQEHNFCGVNAHFRNGISEQAICDLLQSACKQLLYVRTCWPKAVHFALWLYALCNAMHLQNNLPVLEDGTLRLELFSSIHVGSNLKHVHTFGYSVFALQNALA